VGPTVRWHLCTGENSSLHYWSHRNPSRLTWSLRTCHLGPGPALSHRNQAETLKVQGLEMPSKRVPNQVGKNRCHCLTRNI